jgi:hypothetical protein
LKVPQLSTAFASYPADLGAARHYFPARDLYRSGNLIAFFALLIGSVLIALVGLNETNTAILKHGPALIDDKLAVPGTIALLLLLLGLVAGRSAYMNWNKGVSLYEHGLAVRERSGVRAWRWEDIISMTSTVTRHYTIGIFTGTTHDFHLTNRLNESLQLTDIYAEVEKLAKFTRDAIFPRLYEQASQQYNAGHVLVFGPVTISNTGIQLGKKTYPWTDVHQVSIQRGIFKVSKRGGGWFSGATVQASAIPNLEVLLNLVHQVVGLQVG